MFTEIPFEDDGDRKLQKATIRKKEEGKRQQDYGIREEREESRTEIQNGTKFCRDEVLPSRNRKLSKNKDYGTERVF